ncbi:MAG: hypothetical protein JSR72_01555 [Proteobacteria bacterium]|nr:hypothetical protein [Pseudomonadota bacterium]
MKLPLLPTFNYERDILTAQDEVHLFGRQSITGVTCRESDRSPTAESLTGSLIATFPRLARRNPEDDDELIEATKAANVTINREFSYLRAAFYYGMEEQTPPKVLQPRGTPEKRPMRDTSKPANGIRQDKVVITQDRSLRQ